MDYQTRPEEIFNPGIKDVKFGKNVRVSGVSNLYGCEIGDDCFIGHFVEIQRGAKDSKTF